MSIPNATPEQLASQARLERRAAGILEAAQARRTAAAGRALARRPDLTDLAAAGVVLAEQARWSA